MRNTFLSYLLLPLFACLSFSISAAPGNAGSSTTSMSPPGAAQVALGDVASQALDLNKAESSALQQALSGIGQAKADAIVAYREANGPFTSVDELLEVKGIGGSLLERNRDKLKVE